MDYMKDYSDHVLSEDWKDIGTIVVWGCGIAAQRCIGKLKNDFMIPCIIDSDDRKWGKSFMGIRVSPLSEAISILGGGVRSSSPWATIITGKREASWRERGY